MLRNSRQTSPVCGPPSPTRYSSNLELRDEDDGSTAAADQDWMDGQLERARVQRAPFYRRLTNSRRRWDHNHHHHHHQDADSALQKFRKSPETEVADPPHSSWRFYTSFDNGEWQRHAVPVLKAEDGVAADQTGEVNGLGRYSRHGGGSTGGCSAGETGFWRGRQSRTRSTAAGEGDSLSDRRRFISCSMESFRGIVASGAVCPDSLGGSGYFARGTVRRSLSPRSQSYHATGVSIFDDRVSIFGDDVTCDDVTRDDSHRKQRSPFVLTGSVKINGVETRLEDKVIVPTKYKNTATGTPEIRISTAEARDGTSGADDVISGKFGRRSVTARRSKAKADEDRGEARGQRPNCTTGMGEDRPLKALAKVENGSLEKFRQNEGGNDSEEKWISIRNKEQNKNSRLIVGRRSDAVRMREEQEQERSRANGALDALENGLAPEKATRVEKQESRDKINHSTALGTLSSAAAEDKVTKADDKVNPADDCRCRGCAREMDSGTVGSTRVPVEQSRNGEIQEQKQEPTSNASILTKAAKVPLPETAVKNQATPRFISAYFVNINSVQKTNGGMKSTAKDADTGRKEVLSEAEKKDFSNGQIPEASDDDEWIVEMAVRD